MSRRQREFEQAAKQTPRGGFLGEFLCFLKENRKWWLLPVVGLLLLLALLAVLGGTGAAPFIYSLF